MKYDYLVSTPGGDQIVYGISEDWASYAAIVAPFGWDIIQQTPAGTVGGGDTLDPKVRARNGRLPVQLRKGDQVLTWSVDDSGGIGIDELLTAGWKVVDYQGRRDAEVVQQYLWGGWLIDGHPINVITGLGWIQGQMEVIRPYAEAGEIPTPYLMVGSSVVRADAALDQATYNVLVDAIVETEQGVRRPVTAGPSLLDNIPWDWVAGAAIGLLALGVGRRML